MFLLLLLSPLACDFCLFRTLKEEFRDETRAIVLPPWMSSLCERCRPVVCPDGTVGAPVGGITFRLSAVEFS